jgi:Spy/CpxP family protein refolding chaperone
LTVTPTPSPSNTRTTAFVVVIIAFVAGLFVGIAGDRLYFHRMFPGRRDFGGGRIVERLNRELHLTADQKSQVQKIIDSHRAHIESLMTNVRPEIRKELDATNAEIEKVLTPEQRAQFEKIRMRMQSRHGMPPPPPPQ